MPYPFDPTQYEPTAVYDARQQRIENRRLQREQEREIRRLSLAVRRGELAQQLPPYQAPVPEPPLQPTPPNPVLGALQQGLEMVGRPAAAVRGTIGAAQQGQPLGGGFMAGLQGAPVPSGPEILERAGVPELGRFRAGPIDITGRQALGFGVELATDPLMLATLPVGGGGSALYRGVRAIAPGVAKTGAGRIALGGPAVARQAGGLAQPSVQELTQQITQRQTSYPARALRSLSGVPVVGGAVRRITDVIDPSVLAEPAKRVWIASKKFDENKQQLLNTLLVEKKVRIPRNPFPIVEQAGEQLTSMPDGKLVQLGDLMENQGGLWDKYKDALTLEQRNFQPAWGSLMEQVTQYAERAGVKFERTAIPAGGVYYPRMNVDAAGNVIAERQIPRRVGGKKTFQFEREVPVAVGSAEALAKRGRKLISDPDQVFEYAVNQRLEAIKAEQIRQTFLETGIAKQASKDVRDMVPVQWATAKKLLFRPEDAAQIQKWVDARANEIPRKLANWAAWPRMFATTFDMAAGLIQGMPELARNPANWARGQKSAFMALKDPSTYYRLMSSRIPTYRKWLSEGLEVPISNPEMFQAMAMMPGWMPSKVTSFFGRFQLAFDAFGDDVRFRAAETLYPIYKQAGRLDELGDFVARMTGISGELGISPTQKAWEGALLFAPRYTRAFVALIGRAFMGDMAAAEARATLAQMLGAGLVWHTHLADLAGQEPNLNPADSRFLSLKLGNSWVGPGSIWIQAMRLFSRTVEQPASWLSDDELKPNPLYRFWAGRTAPTVSALIEVLRGKTYLSKELDTPLDYAELLVAHTAPMVLDAYLLQNPRADFGTAVPQLLGARVFPESYGETLERLAQKKFGMGYREITPEQQVELSQEPEITRREVPGGQLGKRITEREQIYGGYQGALEDAAKRLQAGEETGRAFREREGQLHTQRNIELAGLEKRFPRQAPKEPLTENEMARQTFLGYYRPDPTTGEIDYDAAEAYLASLTNTQREYIEAKQRAGFTRMAQEAPTAATAMKALWSARKDLRPYWNVWRDTMKKRNLYDLWQRMDSVQQAQLKLTPQYKQVDREVGKLREAWRKKNPAADKLLVYWGYTSRFVS